jgi:hypothetical protein
MLVMQRPGSTDSVYDAVCVVRPERRSISHKAITASAESDALHISVAAGLPHMLKQPVLA